MLDVFAAAPELLEMLETVEAEAARFAAFGGARGGSGGGGWATPRARPVGISPPPPILPQPFFIETHADLASHSGILLRMWARWKVVS